MPGEPGPARCLGGGPMQMDLEEPAPRTALGWAATLEAVPLKARQTERRLQAAVTKGALDDGGASRTNRVEAEAIVKGIEAHYLEGAKRYLTLGVVTFNQPQQALI